MNENSSYIIDMAVFNHMLTSCELPMLKYYSSELLNLVF